MLRLIELAIQIGYNFIVFSDFVIGWRVQCFLNDINHNGISKFQFCGPLIIFSRCFCGNCVPLKQAKESNCCIEMPPILQLMVERQVYITQSSSFANVSTDKAVFTTAMHTSLAFHGPVDDEPLNG